MSIPAAASISALAAIVTNRVFAVGIGLWLQVPAALLLGMLLVIDGVQIPFYYRLYEHGSTFLENVPILKNLAKKDWSDSTVSRWAKSLGGIGVVIVAALPTFGGGIWSAAFVAYGLRMKRREAYSWIMLGSLLSYLTLYWVLDTLMKTFRYFVH